MACDDSPCTQAVWIRFQDFLDLFERLYPQAYLDPLKSPGPGYEVLQAYARMLERLSLAVARLDCGSHILQSFGVRFSVTTVEFSRPDTSPTWPAPGTVTIKAGTVVLTSKSRRQFATTADVTFFQNDLGPKQVPVIALLPAFEFNVPGRKFALNGEELPGDIDTVDKLLTSPSFPDVGVPNFVVAQVEDATCGRPGMLDALGEDRGLPRNPGESDDAYRSRIRTLPDTVSPDAIVRSVLAYLSNFCGGTLTFDFIETWQSTYQTAYDCPSPNAGTPTFQAVIPAGLDTNLFTYDDPRPAYPPFRNRWLSTEDFRGAFIVVVPDVEAISDVGLGYDDTASGIGADLTTACGTRALGAYDIPSDFSLWPAGGYDGFDLGKQALYKGLFDLLERIRAAGVLSAIELQGQ
jgi:hypothetical protein